jgi:hypothetical protein
LRFKRIDLGIDFIHHIFNAEPPGAKVISDDIRVVLNYLNI